MIALASFVAGLLAGGLLSGLVLWLASGISAPVPEPWRHAAILAVAVLALLRDWGLVPIPLPQNARQVPQDVLRRSLVGGALQFGVELGTGVRTFVSASAPYLLAVAVFLAGQAWQSALLAGAGFGAGRAATAVLRYAAGDGERWDDRLRSRLRLIIIGGSAAIAVACGLLLLR